MGAREGEPGRGSRGLGERVVSDRLEGVLESVQARRARAEEWDGARDALEAHRLAFEGDAKMLELVLSRWRKEEAASPGSGGVTSPSCGDGGRISATERPPGLRDPRGNTALHVAVLRGNVGCAEVLLRYGYHCNLLSRAGWTCMDEAIGSRDEAMVKLLYTQSVAAARAEFESQGVPRLAAALQGMPDCTMVVKWRVDSPVLGPLVRRYAPSDTYTVWKRGSDLRVDSTLVGVDDDGHADSAEGGSHGGWRWRRGRLSVLFRGSSAPGESALWVVDHDAKCVSDAFGVGVGDDDDEVNEEVALIMDGAEIHKQTASARDIKFRHVRKRLLGVVDWGLLGRGGQEEVEVKGWRTKAWAASARIKTKQTRRCGNSKQRVPKGMTWEQYLSSRVEADGENATEEADENEEQQGWEEEITNVKKESCRFWMADDENFPLKASHFLPILEVMQPTNRYMGAMLDLVTAWVDLGFDAFPVKTVVPLGYTVYATSSLCNFSPREFAPIGVRQDEDALFSLPAGYDMLSMTDYLEGNENLAPLEESAWRTAAEKDNFPILLPGGILHS